MTTPTELRRENLNVLLSGKGAKSALARLLSLSPASVTGMLNGVKPLDKELLHNVTQALHLPENWFDKERAETDIPAGAIKLLSPLVRGASAPPAAPKTRAENKAPAATNGGGGTPSPSPAPAPEAKAAARAPAPVDKPATWPAQGSGTKVSRLRDLTGGNAADNAASTASATPAATPAAAAPASTPAASSAPIRVPSREVPEQQRGDTYAGMSAVLSEAVLPPIAEALIKTLAQKASSGALSEDKAFELLGSVRTL